ncbi:membrane protein [Exiguobacterium mexicanum]|nr:membrane protein [Exiguobacterium mexicanum]
MKKWERDVLMGWIVVLLVLVAHYIITVSLGNTYFAESTMNRMLWLSSFPAFLIAFLAALFQKTNTLMLAVRRGVIWTAELVVGFAAVAWFFRAFETLFVSPGAYWLFGAVLLAPLVYLFEFRRQNRGTKAGAH